jgi:hypothetical protein
MVLTINILPYKIQKVLVILRNELVKNNYFFQFYMKYIRKNLLGKGVYFVSNTTDIIIEGFPRCANTFSCKAFSLAQNKSLKIAHHTHLSSQIIEGVKLGIPTLVLIRNPLDAVISLYMKDKLASPYISILRYINFYKNLLPYKGRFIIGEFNQITNNFHSIIKKINEKYLTDFELFYHTEKNIKEVFKLIDIANKARGQNSLFQSSKPEAQKDIAKNQLRKILLQDKIFKQKFKKAELIYKFIVQ